MLANTLDIIECSLKKFVLFQIKCTFWGVMYTVAALVFPNAISKIIDQVMIKGIYHLSFFYLALILISGILMIVFNYTQYMNYYQFGQKSKLIIREKLFIKLMKSGGGFRQKYSNGNILRIIEQDAEQIENLIGEGIGQLMVNSIVVLGVIILLLSKQIVIGGIMIGVSLFFAILQISLSNSLKKETNDLRKELGDTSSYTNEMINRSEQIITSGYVNEYIKKFYDKNKIIMTKDVSQMRRILAGRNIGIAYNVISNVVTLGIGIIEIKNGNMTIGTMLAISMYVQRLYNPLLIISNSYLSIKKSVPYVEKIREFLADMDYIVDGKIEPETQVQGNIRFHDVSFEYDTDYVFLKFNMFIEAKKKTALLGENGSGKSTAIKLLLKIYKCNSGEILLDDRDINEYSNDYFYNNISVMHQSNLMMSGTLKEIINPGNREIDSGYMYELFQRVKLDIGKFDNGIDTFIHENNINISGGELQKLNIIRILIEDRPIIILDEPTSALDNDSEIEICELLRDILSEKTVIIITHRKKILEICDNIIKIN